MAARIDCGAGPAGVIPGPSTAWPWPWASGCWRPRASTGIGAVACSAGRRGRAPDAAAAGGPAGDHTDAFGGELPLDSGGFIPWCRSGKPWSSAIGFFCATAARSRGWGPTGCGSVCSHAATTAGSCGAWAGCCGISLQADGILRGRNAAAAAAAPRSRWSASRTASCAIPSRMAPSRDGSA